MKNKIAVGILCFLSLNLFSQNNPVDTTAKNTSANLKDTTNFNMSEAGITSMAVKGEPLKDKTLEKPTIGFGVGLLSYYGGVYGFQSPLTSRIGYEVNVAQRLTKCFTLNLNFLYGQLGDNNRSLIPANNVNFQSQISAGSIGLTYNFGNLLPDSRMATPFVSLGIESIEFLSKTNLYAGNGDKYYYWTDGTMRNLPQNAPNANTAVLLQRNYLYESDLRQTTMQTNGRYSEYSFAIPVGAGFIFKINDYITFRISSTLHSTFTKYIDGDQVNHDQKFLGMKTSGDFFMMNSFGINYNFGIREKEIPEKENIDAEGKDFLAMDTEDRDKDGVIDIKDNCQSTPAGVAVDTCGCPFDDDGDGIPNYKDDEIHSPKGAIVNNKGVTMTDSLYALRYKRYMGTISEYATVEELQAHMSINKETDDEPEENKEYVVSLGTYEKGVPTDLLTKFLGIKDIEGIKISNNSSMYIAGRYNNLEDAEKRKAEFIAQGIPNAKVVYKENKDKDTTYRDVEGIQKIENKYVTDKRDIVTNNVTSKKEEVVVKQTIANSSVNKTTTVTVDSATTSAKTEGGATAKETTTSSNLTTTTTVATTTTKNTTPNETKKEYSFQPSQKATDTKGADVVFRVQLGAYSKPLSKSVFLGIQDLIEITTENGLYKYTSKAFNNMEDAARFRVNMILEGYDGAFITAYKNGKRITLSTAGATLSEPKKEPVEVADTAKINVVNKQLVTFKVQVGIYKDVPPEDKLKIFEQMKNVVAEKTITGLTRYVIGNFSEFVKAEEFRYELIKKFGVSDPFVIALFHDEYITVPEALELLK